MAINLYERPAEQKFVDTYAPLPFQEAMQVGQQFQRERERTEQALQEFYTEYGDFMSPSAVDIERMTEATTGTVKPLLERGRMDPDYLRSREGQADVMRAIRSVDRSKIGQLRQGAEMLREKAKLRAKLESEGRYKKSWDPHADLSTYDTLAQGIIDPSILEYKSMEELASPYTQDLKPGYLGHIDPTSYMVGITKEDVWAALEPQFESITSTPQGQAWMKDIATEMAQYGITDPEAIRQETLNRLAQSQYDKTVRSNIEFDDRPFKMEELAIKRARWASEKAAAQGQPLLLDQVRVTGDSLLTEMSNMLSNNPTVAAQNEALAKEYQAAEASGNRQAMAEVQQRAAQAQSDQFANFTKNVFLTGANKNDMSQVKSYEDKADGADKVLNMYGIQADLSAVDDILSEVVGERSEKSGAATYTVTDLTNFKTGVKAVSQMNGVDIKVADSGIEKLLKEGGISRAKVTPVSGKNIITQVQPNGEIRQLMAVDVEFTEDDLNKDAINRISKKSVRTNVPPGVLAGATSEEARLLTSPVATVSDLVRKARGSAKTIEAPSTGSETTTIRETLQGTFKTVSETGTVKGESKRVFSVKMYIDVPDERRAGEERMAAGINQRNLKRQLTAKSSTEEYPRTVEAAFDTTLRQQNAGTSALKQFSQQAIQKYK